VTPSSAATPIQDKVWVTDPDGAPWEVYTILDDQPAELPTVAAAACCATV
jgi:hypothetical protein